MRIDTLDPALGFLEGGGKMAALIKSLDWSNAPLGEPATWPEALKMAVGTCLSSRFPMVVWWGPDLIMLYNDAWQPILGATKHPGGLGRPGAESWPETWPIVGRQFAEALNGIASWSEDLLLASDRQGFIEECYFTYSHSPLRDATGTVVGVYSAVSETTARVLGERRLRMLRNLSGCTVAATTQAHTIETACRLLLELFCTNNADASFGVLYLLAANGRAQRVCCAGIDVALFAERAAAADDDPWGIGRVLQDRSPAVSGTLSAAMPPLPGGVWPEPTRQVVALPLMTTERVREMAGVLVVGVNARLRLDGPYLDYLNLVAAQFGSLIGAVQSLEADQRNRQMLEQVLDAVEDGYQAVDRDGRFTYMNRAALRMLREQGVEGSALIGQRIYGEAFQSQSEDTGYHGFMRCMTERVPVEAESLYEPWKRWYAIKWFPMSDGGVTIYFRDITEAKNTDEARSLLVQEVDHRAKNTLAVAQAIVSMGSGPTVPAFKHDVEARLAALSRAHNLLAQSRWRGADLRTIVSDELGAVGAEGAFSLAGPHVVVVQAAVQPISLILHELATNARKYGALREEHGSIRISWMLESDHRLALCWRECDGPPTVEPAAGGFGTKLISALAGQLEATIDRRWHPSGLVVWLRLPTRHLSLVEGMKGKTAARPQRPVHDGTQILAGQRVLIVEDEALVAMALADTLAEVGAQIVGPASQLGQGLELARSAALDAAVLDINLNGTSSFAIADVLAQRGLPFVFCSGYGLPEMGSHRGRPILRKPAGKGELVSALHGVLSEASLLSPLSVDDPAPRSSSGLS